MASHNNNRVIWVDNVKVIACILVVLGHFFQSMIKSSILLESNLYDWFIQTIYTFHVPLFFLCSGYLYQKYSKVYSINAWKNNVLKKLIALGIPYIVFSTCTWVMKTVFSSNVNSEVGSLYHSLVIEPLSPYWYLYALFFIFVITPTFKNKHIANIALIVSLLMYAISEIIDTNIYLVGKILEREIWFMLGIALNINNIDEKLKDCNNLLLYSLAATLIFIVSSLLIFRFDINYVGTGLLLGVLGCLATVMIVITCFKNNNQTYIFYVLAKYTMPIFLMHTIFAAALRITLLKLHIVNPVIHISSGIAISFAGPIIAAIIMNKTRILEIVLYPTKYIKVGNKKNENTICK